MGSLLIPPGINVLATSGNGYKGFKEGYEKGHDDSYDRDYDERLKEANSDTEVAQKEGQQEKDKGFLERFKMDKRRK